MRHAPCRTTQVPLRDLIRETVRPEGWPGCSALRRARAATATTAGRELPAGGVPAGEFGEPAVHARRGGLQFPSFRDDDQAGARRDGGHRIAGLADQQRPPGPLGEVLGDGAQEALVGGVEHGPAGLAVETEHAPDLAGRCLQPRDHLLIAAHGLVETPATAARGIAAGGLVQGRNPGPRPGDVGHLVHVVAVVLVRQPLGGEIPPSPRGSGWWPAATPDRGCTSRASSSAG